MNANIKRHAFTDFTGKKYIDTVGKPVVVKPYTPNQNQPVERTIIRNNTAANTDCGCGAPSSSTFAPALAPTVRAPLVLAPVARSPIANAPVSRSPVLAPILAHHSPALSPRPALAPQLSTLAPKTALAPGYTAAAPPLHDDNGKWAGAVRKDNLFAVYTFNC